MSFLKISKAKNDLKQMILTINQLHQYHNCLKTSGEAISEEEFDEVMGKFQFNKNILDGLLRTYENNELQRILKKKLHKRAKRRKSIILKYKEAQIRKRKLHDIIDESLFCVRNDINKAVKKEKFCNKIKYNLSAIKRKIFIAKKRIKEIEHQCVSLEENEVDDKIKKSLKLWSHKLNECYGQEKILKDTLVLNSQSLEDQWYQALFGNIRRNCKPNSTELRKFFEIRKIWDSYLINTTCSQGSSIPFGWVFPPENPVKPWAKYLFENNSEEK